MTPETPPAAPQTGRFFYGWVIVAVMAAVGALSMALGTLNFGLFIKPMGDELGVGRSVFGLAQSAPQVASALTAPLIGRLIDRFGVRVLLAGAAVATGVWLSCLALVTAGWQIVLLFALMGLIGVSGGGALITTVPVTKWFVRKRGRALSFMSLGFPIGGLLFVPMTQMLIDGVGWRTAWIVLGVLGTAAIVPMSLLLVRRQPEDLGLRPDGAPAQILRPGEAPELATNRARSAADGERTPARPAEPRDNAHARGRLTADDDGVPRAWESAADRYRTAEVRAATAAELAEDDAAKAARFAQDESGTAAGSTPNRAETAAGSTPDGGGTAAGSTPNRAGTAAEIAQTEGATADELTAAARAGDDERSWTRAEALRSPTFWRLVFVFSAIGLATGTIALHRIPSFMDRGLDPRLISYATALDAAAAGLTSFAVGLLVGRVPARLVGATGFLALAVAAILTIRANDHLTMFASMMVFGVGIGTMLLMQSYLWAAYFGRHHLGSIRGAVLPLTLLSGGAGAPLSGYVRDVTGSYEPVWLAATGLIVLAAAVLALTPPPSARRRPR